MAEFHPFAGLYYNPEIVSLPEVVAPPYDVISVEDGEALQAKHPHNVVRLILNQALAVGRDRTNPHELATENLRSWCAEGVLQLDERPCIYLYQQRYQVEGVTQTRTGVVARLRINDTDGGVFPHEVTLEGPKADRLELLRMVRANLSPIFTFVQAQEDWLGALVDSAPEALELMSSFTWDEVDQSFWRVVSQEVREEILQRLSTEQVFIADGHHRYEVAKAYYKERAALDDADSEYVLAYCATLTDTGTPILPIHRVLGGLDEGATQRVMTGLETYCDLQEYATSGELVAAVQQHRGQAGHVGVYTGKGGGWLASIRHRDKIDDLLDRQGIQGGLRELDATLVRVLVCDELLGFGQGAAKDAQMSYTDDATEAIGLVDQGHHQLAVLLNPPPLETVCAVAASGQRMPPKTTFFAPKLLTGLIFNPLDTSVIDATKMPVVG